LCLFSHPPIAHSSFTPTLLSSALLRDFVGTDKWAATD